MTIAPASLRVYCSGCGLESAQPHPRNVYLPQRKKFFREIKKQLVTDSSSGFGYPGVGSSAHPSAHRHPSPNKTHECGPTTGTIKFHELNEQLVTYTSTCRDSWCGLVWAHELNPPHPRTHPRIQPTIVFLQQRQLYFMS